MVDYKELTREELYKMIATKNKGVIHFIYNKYAPAIYGLILKKVPEREVADDILFKTFMLCIKTQPNPSQALPGIFIRLHNIASNIMNKRSILYPIRTEANILLSQNYS